MSKVACIGECMIELKQAEGGLFSRGFGGDTLNTAVYLARLGAGVDYITALGDDALSDEMIAGWAAEARRTGATPKETGGPHPNEDRPWKIRPACRTVLPPQMPWVRCEA